MEIDGRKIKITPELETKNFEKQIGLLLDQIEDLQFQLQTLEPNSEEFQKVSVELEKAKNKLGTLIQKQSKLNQETSKVDFSRWTKQLTKVGFALFSVRGAMGVIRKASSTYLSQNEKTAQKLQALWTALGNIVGPVLERIADAVLKLVGYLNVFVKTLSGGKIDLTRNMNLNTKAINGTAKAMKELNRQTASFDEMNTLSSQSSSDGIAGGVSSAFSMPELNPKIVAFLEKLAIKLKENWDWIWKVGVALAAVFGIVKIAGILRGISTLMGSGSAGTGLLGLSGVLKGLATIGVITIGVSLLYTGLTGRQLSDDLAQIKKNYDGVKKTQEAFASSSGKNNTMLEKLINTYHKLEESNKATAEKTKSYADQLIRSTNSNMEYNKELKKQLTIVGELNGSNDATRQSMKNLSYEISTTTNELLRLYENGKLNNEQTKQLTELIKNQIASLEKQNSTLTESSDRYKENYAKINELKSSLDTITGKKYEVKVEIPEPKTSGFKTFFNNLLGGVEKPLNSLGWKIKLPRLAKGGIVNMPGRGVPIGGAIAGEAGREAVLPLQDTAVLNEIADAIGRRITINANITNMMNGRVISRELQKVQNESNFASNR